MRVDLPYGRVPYPLDLVDGARVLRAPVLPAPEPLADLLDRAFASPIGAPALEQLVHPRARVVIIVSDATRHEPRLEMLDAVLARVRHAGAVHVTVAIATGTHGRAGTSLVGDRRVEAIIDHDGASDIVMLGTTSRGTPIRIHRCVLDADLVVATGCIRPHYFAGFGAGAKAVFPGLGEATAIRINHAMKTLPGARAGHLDTNPCRLDLEEAVGRVPTPRFLVNVVAGSDDAIRAAVCGDVVVAHRAGAALARPWFTVRATPSMHVIASDALPVSGSLYQAAKIAAAAAPLVAAGGRLTLVAECADGIEPLAVVNDAIFRIGVLPRLAEGATLELVSSLDSATVARTLLAWAPSTVTSPTSLVIPHASGLLCEIQ